MSNLFASLRSAADAMDVLQQSVAVAQNNVMNASTPGYVRQSVSTQSREFLPANGFLGGVALGQIRSARDLYAEANVRAKVADLGASTQQYRSMTALEDLFPLNDASGVPDTLSSLLQSFSAWSVAPSNAAAQQNVVAAAAALGDSFQRTAARLSGLTQDTDQQIRSTVDDLNALAGQIRTYNERRQAGGGEDAGLDAQVHEALEQISAIAGISVIRQTDGTHTVLLNGQTPLVIGSRQTMLSVQFVQPSTPPPVYSGAPPQAAIVDAQTGADLTSMVTSSKLGALLAFRNTTLAQYQGDSQTQGMLNQAAKAFADRVNQILSPGTPLFTYDSSSGILTASTLKVNPSVDLSAIPPDSAGAANGKAVALAGLASSVDPLDQINGMSYSAYLGQIAAGVGKQAAGAKSAQDTQSQLAVQAQNFRAQLSGVSLDEEAVRLVEFQRAYQATARMVTVLNDMTEVVLNMMQ